MEQAIRITATSRLEIDQDGSGFLSVVSGVRTAPVDVYRVKQWTLSDWSLALELDPRTHDAESFQFQRVRVGYTEMECEFAGGGGGRKATLFSERRFARPRGAGAEGDHEEARKIV